METIFTPVEIRVLGCLIEKERTTPESYPLTLNSLTRACNQKSNREPVMELAESTVLEAVESLIKQMLISTRSGADGRVTKYSHRLRDRRTVAFDFNPAELAAVSTLLLRGPQTLGEIRTRCARIHHFDDMGALATTLEHLAERQDGPYVKMLPRLPGHKEPRYMHLFAGDIEVPTPPQDYPPQQSGLDDNSARITELEIRISKLQKDLSVLEQRLSEFIKQFE